MAKEKPNQYSIRGKKYKTFAAATAAAVDHSIQSGEQVTIVEHNPNSNETFHISITAVAEEA
jgi:hypothetical protein